MVDASFTFSAALAALAVLPFLGALGLGAALCLKRPPTEQSVNRAVGSIMGILCAICAGLALSWLRAGLPVTVARFAPWYHWGNHGVALELRWDGLSATMVSLSLFLSALTGFFSAKYLHRDSGFHRFFLLYLFFVAGIVALFLANSWDLLVMGWEAVGISSVLLIAFFQFRREPIR